jgi:hypothetical protein
MTPPGHVFPAPHQYIYVLDFRRLEDKEASVYAPGDMVLKLLGIRHYNMLGQKSNYNDYTLVFAPCREFILYFHHVTTLTYAPFVEAAAKILPTCSFSTARNEDFCQREVSIPISAGVKIGTTGDSKAGVGGLDIGARDYRIANGRSAFIVPDRFCRGGSPNPYDRCFTVCAFDYFTPDSIVDLQFSQRGVRSTVSPVCGSIYLDLTNTAQGYWFFSPTLGSTSGGEELNLFLGPDNASPTVGVFSFGTSQRGLQPGIYSFQQSDSGYVNRNFGQITVGGNIYCYEVHGGPGQPAEREVPKVLILQLLDSKTIRIEKTSSDSCQSGPWSFTDNAVMYVR